MTIEPTTTFRTTWVEEDTSIEECPVQLTLTLDTIQVFEADHSVLD